MFSSRERLNLDLALSTLTYIRTHRHVELPTTIPYSKSISNNFFAANAKLLAIVRLYSTGVYESCATCAS